MTVKEDKNFKKWAENYLREKIDKYNKEHKSTNIKTNKDRADRIKKMLGLRGEDNDTEYYRVADVICDLMHYCDYNEKHPDDYKIDWDNEMNTALTFYHEELKQENKPQVNQQKG